MASITKLYLRDATWASSGVLGEVDTFAGTMPGTASLTGISPSVVATGASTNRVLSPTKGAAQTTVAITTLGQTAAQSAWFRRFISDPLAAQTIGAQTLTYSGAHLESNGASDFIPGIAVFLWRPSTGATVDTLISLGGITVAEPGTTQTAGSGTGTTKATTATAGDVLVVEVFRTSGTQTNNGTRQNTIAYDGATEASTTDVASFISFATAVSIQTRYTQSDTASLGAAATLTTSYIAAPITNYGLRAVLTHTE